MTIDKAIKTLSEMLSGCKNPQFTDYSDALKLGVEALKYVKGNRSRISNVFLNGETKEN